MTEAPKDFAEDDYWPKQVTKERRRAQARIVVPMCFCSFLIGLLIGVSI